MSTGTELTPIQEKYPALTMNSADMQEAFAANQGPPGQTARLETLLTRVACPKQGSTRWTIQADDGSEQEVSELRGILCYRGFRGMVWPYKDCEAGTLPILRTDDLENAYQVGEDWGDVDQNACEALRRPDGSFPWTGPNGDGGIAGNGGPCGWPLKSDKNAKRRRMAREMRVLGFLGEGQLAPWLIFVPPTSIGIIDLAIRKLSLAGVPYYGAEVRLYAKKEESGGYTISRIYLAQTGKLPAEMKDFIKRSYTDTLAAAIHAVEADAAADDLGDLS